MSNNGEINNNSVENDISVKGAVRATQEGVRAVLGKSDEDVFDETSDSKASEAQNDEERERRANNFIKEHVSMFEEFSGDSTIRYRASKEAETFAFYHRDGKVEIPERWFERGEYDDRELFFASAHELCHFMDMRKNPEAYFGNFEENQRKTEVWAREFCDKHPEASFGKVKNVIGREIHLLYNCLDDIYVNNLAMSRAKTFRDEEHDAVTGLYEKVGFGEQDLTEMPAHLQLAYAMLRDEMFEVGENDEKRSIVSEDVSKILDKAHFGGLSMRKKLVKIKPKNNKLIDPRVRYDFIADEIEPDYKKLLFGDLEDMLKKKNEHQDNDGGSGDDKNGENNKDNEDRDNSGNYGGDEDGENGGNGSDESGENDKNGDSGDDENGGNVDDGEKGESGEDEDPFGQYKKPGFFRDHDLKTDEEILKDFQEESEVGKMSPEEYEEYKRKKEQERFDREHDISPEVREVFDEIMQSMEPARCKMLGFWESLIGESIELRKKTVHNQKRGRIDIDRQVDTFIKLEDAMQNGRPEEAPIRMRTEFERVLVERPDEIQITLLVDGSGSMGGTRMNIARQAAALLMTSINDFNKQLELRKNETGSNLTAKTEVVMFGSDYERVKKFETKRISDRGEAEVIKSISKMTPNYGNTYDDRPIQAIVDGLSSEDERRMKEGKLLKIFFEVTDGESMSKTSTHDALMALREAGVLTFGFQIGPDSEVFNDIWNSDGSSSGIYIGNNVAQLPEKLIKALTKVLEGIKI